MKKKKKKCCQKALNFAFHMEYWKFDKHLTGSVTATFYASKKHLLSWILLRMQNVIDCLLGFTYYGTHFKTKI